MHWSLGLDPKREIGKAEIFDGCAGEGVGGTRCGSAGAGSGVDFFFFFFWAQKRCPKSWFLGSWKTWKSWRVLGCDVGARKNMKKFFFGALRAPIFFFCFVWWWCIDDALKNFFFGALRAPIFFFLFGDDALMMLWKKTFRRAARADYSSVEPPPPAI